MNFYHKKRRTPVLQIISMIDILIILLIFLTVSTSFKEAKSALNVSLPTSREMSLGTTTDDRLSVSVSRDESIHIGDLAVPAEELSATLRRMKADNPAARLELRVDEKASFGMLVTLWDALTRAGFKVNEVPARVLRAARDAP